MIIIHTECQVSLFKVKNIRQFKIKKNKKTIDQVGDLIDGLDYYNQTKNYMEPILDKNGTYSMVSNRIYKLNLQMINFF